MCTSLNNITQNVKDDIRILFNMKWYNKGIHTHTQCVPNPTQVSPGAILYESMGTSFLILQYVFERKIRPSRLTHFSRCIYNPCRTEEGERKDVPPFRM